MGFLSLPDARAHLNDLGSVDDVELEGYIAAAERVVEDLVGPVAPRAVDEFLHGGRADITLTHYPVLSVQAVTEYAGTLGQALALEPLSGGVFSAFGYTLDAEQGVLARTTYGAPVRFATGRRNVRVQYTAGRSPVPENIRLATLELVRLNWGPQRSGGPAMPYDEEATGQSLRMSYGRVKSMLAPDLRGPVVA